MCLGIVGSGIIFTFPAIFGRVSSRSSASGAARARAEENLKSEMSFPINSWRLPTTNVSGRFLQLGQFPVLFSALQFGQWFFVLA